MNNKAKQRTSRPRRLRHKEVIASLTALYPGAWQGAQNVYSYAETCSSYWLLKQVCLKNPEVWTAEHLHHRSTGLHYGASASEALTAVLEAEATRAQHGGDRK